MGGHFGGKWIHVYIYMVESLCCSPETLTTLLIGYTPIQNTKFKKKKTYVYKTTCTWMFIAVLFLVVKRWKHIQTSINRWIDKQKIVYTHNRIWFIHKKEWNTDACNNMDEYWKHHAKWKRTVTKDYILYGSIHMKVQTRETRRLRLYQWLLRTGWGRCEEQERNS